MLFLPDQHAGHGVGQFILHVRYGVGVQIQGDANLGMTQGFAKNLRVYVLLKRQSCIRMPQAMKNLSEDELYVCWKNVWKPSEYLESRDG